MKVVIQMMAGRALMGVQDENTDPFLEPVTAATLEEVLAAVPGVVARARERWATQPKGATYQAPAPPPRQPVAATASPATPAAPKEPKQGAMTRMF